MKLTGDDLHDWQRQIRPLRQQKYILGYPASTEEYRAVWATIVTLAVCGAALILVGLPPVLRLAVRWFR